MNYELEEELEIDDNTWAKFFLKHIGVVASRFVKAYMQKHQIDNSNRENILRGLLLRLDVAIPDIVPRNHSILASITLQETERYLERWGMYYNLFTSS